ncbi:MAG TPA: CpsD/CapB family tyrosine-protein kinase [Paracoccaceae bacterium]|nr:CpsD/CapB family tyrosine-protein kinase [Paracoccaceae bacterium]HMO72374.1 CpsD/CapB family tyrosine-protein kinase [Paracoccaceae bacterium]
MWESLVPVTLDRQRLLGNGVFLHASEDPAARAFDMLRTRTLQAMQDHGWRRLAVTSPGPGCGTSLVTANLALSLARLTDGRTLAVDLNLRAPGLARTLALRETQALHDVLTGAQPLEAHALRHGETLALALNGKQVADPGACLQAADTAAALASMIEYLDPDMALFDLPPALVADDALAVSHAMDAVLLVVDGRRTRPDDIIACERLFEGRLPILGMVLNRAQDFGLLAHPFRRWQG